MNKGNNTNHSSLKMIEQVSNSISQGLERIAAYNNYLKTRMDFLADIATSMPTMETGRAFKADILKELDTNRLLLNTISGVDNFKFTFDFKYISADNCYDNDIDPIISIPNDILGYHSLYVIVENVIRNTAKHSGSKRYAQNGKTKPIVFTFEIRDVGNDFYELTIYDDIELGRRIDEIVNKQNRNISDEILKDNKLRDGAWGVLEMKASAAYLRKINLEYLDKLEAPYEDDKGQIQKEKLSIEDYYGQPYLLCATKTKENYLGYKLYLRKPKNLLIWDYASNLNGYYGQNNLSNIGINILPSSPDKITCEIFPHQLLVVNCGSNSYEDFLAILIRNESGLPQRILLICEEAPPLNHRLRTKWIQFIKKESVDLGNLLENPSIAFKELYLLYLKEYNTNNGIYSSTVGAISVAAKSVIIKSETQASIRYNYDHHGAMFNQNQLKAFDFFEAYPSVVKHAITLSTYTAPYPVSDQILAVRLNESAMLRIGIIDERIQSAAEEIVYYPYKGKSDNNSKPENIAITTELINHLYKSFVFIPRSKTENQEQFKNYFNEEFVDFNQPTFDIEDLNRTIKFVNITNIDYLFIHLSIIEKFISAFNSSQGKSIYSKDTGDDIIKFYSEQVKSQLNNADLRVIIVSGRGKPSNLPKGLRYCNYSMLQQYAIDKRLKLFMADLAFNARKLG